jgi:simple sugar transport system permease protein
MKNTVGRYLILFGYPLLAIILALLASRGLILAVGASPVVAFRALFIAVWQCEHLPKLIKSTPLLFAALGMCAAFRAEFGISGPKGNYISALMTAIVGIYAPLTSKLIAIPAMVLQLFGRGVLAAIPAGSKAFGVSEIITTIMMNYIAIFLISYMIHYPLRDPQGYLPNRVPYKLRPNYLFYDQNPLTFRHCARHSCSLVMYIIFKKTTLGYQMRVVGHNR